MGVYLMGRYLMGVYLTGVYLTSVYLTGVHLIGLYLYLRGVYLMGVYHTLGTSGGVNYVIRRYTKLIPTSKGAPPKILVGCAPRGPKTLGGEPLSGRNVRFASHEVHACICKM